MTARQVLNLLDDSARANQASPLRRESTLHLPGSGELIVAGDLHNHQRNFERVRRYAALERHPRRFVILQELIHGGALGNQGQDTSFDMLLVALQWARDFPGRVHFLLANHDLAQVQQAPVMKDGYNLTQRFNQHLSLTYGAQSEQVAAALKAYVFSQPLAAISATGVFLAHSLPGPKDIATFDPTFLTRPLEGADFVRPGSAYSLVWGRHQTAEILEQLGKAWWADVFICGHQQQDAGFAVVEPKLLIVDSSHNLGTLVHLDLAKAYDLGALTATLVPLANLP
jgi:hypothetical protein